MPKNATAVSPDRQSRRRWATVKQTAEYLGVDTRTVRNMVVDGWLIQYSLGPRVVRIDLAEVDASMTPRRIHEAARK